MITEKGDPSKKHDTPLLARNVQVSSLPKKGMRMTISLSDDEKAALCAFFQLHDIAHFEARLLLEKKTTTTLKLSGHVCADVMQYCVLTHEPVLTKVDEAIEILLLSEESNKKKPRQTDLDGALIIDFDEQEFDTYHHDSVELGGLVLEYFSLGLEPYPQAPDAQFQRPVSGAPDEPSPFAKLVVLQDKLKPR